MRSLAGRRCKSDGTVSGRDGCMASPLRLAGHAVSILPPTLHAPTSHAFQTLGPVSLTYGLPCPRCNSMSFPDSCLPQLQTPFLVKRTLHSVCFPCVEVTESARHGAGQAPEEDQILTSVALFGSKSGEISLKELEKALEESGERELMRCSRSST